MIYLACLDRHSGLHLACRADWLACALRRKRLDAAYAGPTVNTSAPAAVVETLLSYRPLRAPRAFAGCSAR